MYLSDPRSRKRMVKTSLNTGAESSHTVLGGGEVVQLLYGPWTILLKPNIVFRRRVLLLLLSAAVLHACNLFVPTSPPHPSLPSTLPPLFYLAKLAMI
jgi:hypothetical protein